MSSRKLSKEELRANGWFLEVDTSELEGIEEWAEWLEAIVTDPRCDISEDGNDLVQYAIKAQIDRVRGLSMQIYPDDHPPPHFHVRSANIDASFAIDDCRRLKGNVSGSDLKKIRYWHGKAKPKLVKAWDSMRPTDCQVGPIRS